MNVPKLRFKEFNDEWKEYQIKDISNFIDGNYGENYPKENEFISSGIPFITSAVIGTTGIFNRSLIKYISEDKNNVLTKAQSKGGDIILTNRGASMGVTSIIPDDYSIINIGPQLTRIRCLKNFNSMFVLQVLKTPFNVYKLRLMNAGSAMPFISLDGLGKFKLKIPTLNEQNKLAIMLSLIDKKIELQTKKIEDLKLFKLELKERLFKMPETEKKELSDILIKWNKKNKDNKYNYVESVSNKYGFIAQNEQFEDRSVASNDTKNYYVIEKGVFAYNPSRLNVGSLALKENDKVSLVSPLYECFTTNQNKSFLYEWFNSKEFKKGTVSKFEGGVRNTLNFSNLCKIKISLPSIEEQNKIANLLNLYNSLINLENRKLTKLNELKKGLMQNMFV